MKNLTLSIAMIFAVALSAAAQDGVKPVKLTTVSSGVSEQTRQFFGQVVARQTVDLAFQVAGQIVELPIIEGQTIPKGGLIAKLDQEPFELALDQATIQKEQADRAIERLNRLSSASVSQVSIDDAETQANLADIAVRNAEYSLKHATLFAPFDALVAARNVANFTIINAGTPVVRIHDMSELRIEIDVPEILFQQSGKNPKLSITAKFPASNRVFPVEIREFNAETAAIGQTFQITLGMAPPTDLNILPGSSVTVSVSVLEDSRQIRIPVTSLVYDESGNPFVMVFQSEDGETGSVQKTPVTLQATPASSVIVTAGLEPGQEIVAAGASQLADGQNVRRFTGFSR
jgi:RND family efflux transporter MFP subunit